MNKVLILNVVMMLYGFNKKQGKEYIKTADNQTLVEIERFYKNQCKKTFLED